MAWRVRHSLEATDYARMLPVICRKQPRSEFLENVNEFQKCAYVQRTYAKLFMHKYRNIYCMVKKEGTGKIRFLGREKFFHELVEMVSKLLRATGFLSPRALGSTFSRAQSALAACVDSSATGDS